ncbi:MAG: hypothetical protein R2762_00285 [Bryobacteraceae bacterium]
MQHFRVKIYAATQPGFDASAAIPVFHRWIQNNVLDELLIDVADYAHVPAGPGVVLVGHDAFYGLDHAGHRTGLLYTRRTALDGDTGSRIAQAYESALRACRLLENEPEFSGKIRFDPGEWDLSVNDRLLAPNNDESWRKLEPALRQFLDARFGPGTCRAARIGEPRDLLTVSLRSAA